MASSIDTPQLSERDRAVVTLVGKFRQMTSGQIRASLFADRASATPLDRTLKRLAEQRYLSRLRRLVGGDRGGSGQYVYQLGRAGWRLLDRPGAFWAPQAVNLHTLAVADCYVALKCAELKGDLEVIQFITEPECHRVVGDLLLTPDGYFEVGNRVRRVKQAYWLEVDRGTEHPEVIRQKFERYWRAYVSWRDDYYPTVIFVVPDVRRQQTINDAIAQGPREAQGLFDTCVHQQVANVAIRSHVVPTE